jgi:hypothetical protein
MKDVKDAVALIVAALCIIALLGGVTIGGRHYGLRACGDGLVIDAGEPAKDGGAEEHR